MPNNMRKAGMKYGKGGSKKQAGGPAAAGMVPGMGAGMAAKQAMMAKQAAGMVPGMGAAAAAGAAGPPMSSEAAMSGAAMVPGMGGAMMNPGGKMMGTPGAAVKEGMTGRGGVMKAGGSNKGSKAFPDLTGDGKVTRADILKGRGVNITCLIGYKKLLLVLKKEALKVSVLVISLEVQHVDQELKDIT